MFVKKDIQLWVWTYVYNWVILNWKSKVFAAFNPSFLAYFLWHIKDSEWVTNCWWDGWMLRVGATLLVFRSNLFSQDVELEKVRINSGLLWFLLIKFEWQPWHNFATTQMQKTIVDLKKKKLKFSLAATGMLTAW